MSLYTSVTLLILVIGQEHSQFVKVDTTINDYSDIVYLNSLILHTDNLHFVEIIDAFRKVTGGYSEDK
jgi:hypothetical protein